MVSPEILETWPRVWRCDDCGQYYPVSVTKCRRPFYDYLAVHGGSVDAAIERAVSDAITPLVRRAEARVSPTPSTGTFTATVNMKKAAEEVAAWWGALGAKRIDVLYAWRDSDKPRDRIARWLALIALSIGTEEYRASARRALAPRRNA